MTFTYIGYEFIQNTKILSHLFQDWSIEETIVHENFTGLPDMKNNIALLRLRYSAYLTVGKKIFDFESFIIYNTDENDILSQNPSGCLLSHY